MKPTFSTLVLISVLSLLGSLSALAEETPSEESPTLDVYQIEFALFRYRDGDMSEVRYEDRINTLKDEDTELFQYYFEQPYFEKDYPLSEYHLWPVAQENRALSKAVGRLIRDPKTQVMAFYAWQQSLESDTRTRPLKLSLTQDNGARTEVRVIVKRERYLHFDFSLFEYHPAWFKPIDWLSLMRSPVRFSLYDALVPRDDVPHMAAHSGDTRATSTLGSGVRLDKQIDLGNDQAREGLPVLAQTDARILVPFGTLHFNDSRRIKTQEMHYLDHPLFGVIVTISKIEVQDELAEYES